MNEPLLQVKDLVVTYSSDDAVVHAVNGVSFSLEKGKTIGLVGETGAGKTTIAKSILRILPEFSSRIAGGEILFEGKNLLECSEIEMQALRGSRITMIFQDPMTALNPVLRVGDQIAEAISLHDKKRERTPRSQAEEMLEMVGIPKERYGEYPHQFSGGMKQRVVIAMALACNPELLLADEPTTALDVTIQAQVLELIGALKKERNTSMVLITHDLGVVAETCDSVAIVYAGEIVEYGTKEQVFDNPLHPYTRGLFSAIPDIDKKVRRLVPVPGLPPDATDLPSGCHFHTRCPFATDRCKEKPVECVDVGDQHLCRCLDAMKRGE